MRGGDGKREQRWSRSTRVRRVFPPSLRTFYSARTIGENPSLRRVARAATAYPSRSVNGHAVSRKVDLRGAHARTTFAIPVINSTISGCLFTPLLPPRHRSLRDDRSFRIPAYNLHLVK